MRNKNLLANAKNLRKNQTKEERHLWYDFLSLLPVHFTRQKIIDRYIVDFCCASQKLIIELDGSQYYEEDGIAKDRERDEYLKNLGYTVVRYTNLALHENFKNVCEDIYKNLNVK